MTLNILDKVRRNAEVMGQGAWLAELPERVAEIERRWGITVGDTTKNATEAFVAFAQCADGRDAVLKMVIPGFDVTRQEIRMLRGANGAGYVTLLRADDDANILLLERLGPQLHTAGLGDDGIIAAISATLRLAWEAKVEGNFTTGAERAAEFWQVIETKRGTYGLRCAERTFDLARVYAERRAAAFDPATSVLVHGDAHEWNTLQAPSSPTGFKFVDPDGAFAERAFDLAIPMREWGAVLPKGDLLALARHRCALLAKLTDVEPQPIWEWSVLQLLWNGYLLLDVAADAPALVEFAFADALASAGPV